MLTGCSSLPTLWELGIAELDARAKERIEELEKLPDVKPAPPDVVAQGDAVPFADLVWARPGGTGWLGGFDGRNAQWDKVVLSNFRNDGRRIWWKYDVSPTVWGISSGDAGAMLACAFFLRDGKWVGGKFDWCRPSNADRELKHVLSYDKWPGQNLHLPWREPVAFVLITVDGRRRSNVVATGVK